MFALSLDKFLILSGYLYLVCFVNANWNILVGSVSVFHWCLCLASVRYGTHLLISAKVIKTSTVNMYNPPGLCQLFIVEKSCFTLNVQNYRLCYAEKLARTFLTPTVEQRSLHN